jgi:hypothetical protein
MLFQFSENTFKNFYYPENHDDSTDEEGTVGLKVKQALAKKRPANNIDSFFERPKKKTKAKVKSSNVSKTTSDGVTYLSSGQEDAGYASHLIKIELYDMEKIRNMAPADHWKHCDIRLKYYSCTDDDSNIQSVRDVIFNITKQLASKENCVKYFIDTDKNK